MNSKFGYFCGYSKLQPRIFLALQGAMAGAGALLLHEMNKGRVKIEDRLVLEGEALDNDELMLDAEDSVNFD